MSKVVEILLVINNKEYSFPVGIGFSEIVETIREQFGDDVESITVFNEKTRRSRIISNESQMSSFWELSNEISNGRSIEFTYTPKKTPKPPEKVKKVNKFTDGMRRALMGTSIEHVGDSTYFCPRCQRKLTFDCPRKVTLHAESEEHKEGLPGLLLAFLDMFEFPDYKKSKRTRVSNSKHSILYKTVKSKKQIRESFMGFVGKYDIERHFFNRILERCGVHFSKTDSFFCLCPVCQVPGVQKNDPDEYERHRILTKDRSLRFKKDLSDPESLVCVMDFSSNIRSKSVFATQNEGFTYNQWTLFNLTVLQTAESEVVEKYFDVFTFHKYGEERVVKHNSEYIINALSLIFQHQSFEAYENKNLLLWSDNGRRMKSLALVIYLSELSGTKFRSVSQKFFMKFHGKSICDRHFGSIARVRYYSKSDINETEDL